MRFFGTSAAGSIQKVVERAKAAEAYGFDTFTVPDGSPSPHYTDLCVCSTMVALNTKKIKLVPISNPYTRHPALIAGFVSSLAEIAGERVVLGLGPGGSMTLRPLGMKMWEKPLTKISESVMVLRKLFAGETVNFDGETVKVKGVRLTQPLNVKVPICLTARSPRMLELAGEVADGVLLNSPLMFINDDITRIRRGAEKAGRNFRDINISAGVRVSISKDEKKARDQVRCSLVFIMAETPTNICEKAGIGIEMIEDIKNAIDEGNRERAVSLITNEIVDIFGVAGTLENFTKKIEEYFKKGVNEVNLVLNTVEEVK